LTETDDGAIFTGAVVTGFGYEVVSSVGEFTTLSYCTAVLRQSSRLTTYARSVAGRIEISNLSFAGAKGS
ncbi:hypothetical protein AVEN_153789-1, partial [Araneus ventricosus]